MGHTDEKDINKLFNLLSKMLPIPDKTMKDGVLKLFTYLLSDIEGTTEKIARTLGLEQKRLSGTKAYLCDLLWAMAGRPLSCDTAGLHPASYSIVA